MDPHHRPPPPQDRGDGAVPFQQSNHWQAAMDSLRQAVDIARNDPDIARRLLAMATGWTRDRDSYDHGRDPLIQMGIPADFLPTFDEAQLGPTTPPFGTAAATPGRDDLGARRPPTSG